MPGIGRTGDKTKGIGDKDPTAILATNQSSVKVDGVLALVVGDQNASKKVTLVEGSSTVFIEGKAVARKGDLSSRGDVLNSGSPTCNAG